MAAEMIVQYFKRSFGESTPMAHPVQGTEISINKMGIPQHKPVAIPTKDLQPVTTARAKNEQTVSQGILANNGPYSFRQSIEATAHVRGLSRQPDPRYLRTVKSAQTRQSDHASGSSTASSARR